MIQATGEHVVLWAFRVRPGATTAFERFYGPGGEWAKLFRRADGFIATELWRDQQEPGRYMTVDHWRSRDDYERFRVSCRAEYGALDARGAELTESEARLASLEPVQDA